MEISAVAQVKPSPIIIMVRHGDTDLNSGANVERLRGWLNVPLNAEGRSEAQKLKEQFKDVPFRKIYCSDLGRTIETAKPIAKVAKVPLQPSSSFRPWNLGVLQGQPIQMIRRTMVSLEKDNQDVAPPGGESFNSFLDRYLSALSFVMDEAQSDPDRKPYGIVAHTRNMRAAIAWIDKGMPKDFSVDTRLMASSEDPVHTGGVLVLHGVQNGKWDYKLIEPPTREDENNSQS